MWRIQILILKCKRLICSVLQRNVLGQSKLSTDDIPTPSSRKIILTVSTSKLWYIYIWSTFVFNLIATFLIDKLKNKHSILLIKRDASVFQEFESSLGLHETHEHQPCSCLGDNKGFGCQSHHSVSNRKCCCCKVILTGKLVKSILTSTAAQQSIG